MSRGRGGGDVVGTRGALYRSHFFPLAEMYSRHARPFANSLQVSNEGSGQSLRPFVLFLQILEIKWV